jgi:NADH-quinone oxidoreductase subunit H
MIFATLVFPGGLYAVALALLLRGLDRKLLARFQRRGGPPVLQAFHDTSKLLRKQTLVPREANAAIFLGAPVVGFAAMVSAAALVPLPGVATVPGLPADIIVLLYLLAVPGIAIMLAGSSSGSLYGAVGFSREMSLILAYEGPLLFALVAVAMYVGRAGGGEVTLSLREIVEWQRAHGPNLSQPVLWPALLAYLACLPATLGVGPFDIAEAETEVLEGPLLEYSGPPLALLQLMQSLQRLVVVALGVVLFWPNGPEGLLAVPVFALKVVAVAAVTVTLLRASFARMRIGQALLFLLTWPEALSAASIVLVLLTVGA